MPDQQHPEATEFLNAPASKSVVGFLREFMRKGATNVEVGRAARRLIDLEDAEPFSAYVESAAVKVYDEDDEEKVGVRAVAKIMLANPPRVGGALIAGEISSGGLWQIDSPSKDYLRDVGGAELNQLADALAALGLRLPEDVDWSVVDNWG